MVRRWAAAFFATVFILTANSAPLAAQGRGGRGGHVGGGVRVGPGGGVHVGPGRVVVAPGPVFVGRPHVVGPRFVGPGFGIGIAPFPGAFLGPRPFGVYSPFGWSTPIYASPAYVEPAYVQQPYVQVQPQVNQNDVELSYQVQRLSQEMEQLRQEQALAAARQPAPPSQVLVPDRPAIPIVLVFRDGRRMQIQNYALVGQTLWVLDENTSRKIPLSELDLDAIQTENRGQGIRLPQPAR